MLESLGSLVATSNININTPPGTIPAVGTLLLIGSAPTGVFTGFAGHIAQVTTTGYTFIATNAQTGYFATEIGFYRPNSSFTAWEELVVTGASSIPIVLTRGQVVDIFMSPTGDDNNDGLTVGTPIATFRRLNELLNGYRALAYSTATTGNDPRIDVLMEAGSYAGDVISVPDFGKGTINFNFDENAVTITSTLAFIDCGSQTLFLLDTLTFEPSGYDTTGTSVYFNPYSVNQIGAGGGASGGYYPISFLLRYYLLWRNYSDNFNYMGIFVSNSSVICRNNCVFEPASVAGRVATNVVDMNGRLVIRDSIVRVPNPLVFMDNDSYLQLRGITFDYAAATPMRYLVNAGLGCKVSMIFSATNNGNNFQPQYLVRANHSDVVQANNAWAELVGLAPTFAGSGIIDNEYSSAGTGIDTFDASSSVAERTFAVNASANLRPDEWLGSHYMFYGTGVVGTIIPEAFQINGAKNRGQRCVVSAADGASLVIDLTNSPANGVMYVNGSRLVTPTTNLTGAAGTTIEFFWLNIEELHIRVIEGALV